MRRNAEYDPVLSPLENSDERFPLSHDPGDEAAQLRLRRRAAIAAFALLAAWFAFLLAICF